MLRGKITEKQQQVRNLAEVRNFPYTRSDCISKKTPQYQKWIFKMRWTQHSNV